jgi:hypothetical protein
MRGGGWLLGQEVALDIGQAGAMPATAISKGFFFANRSGCGAAIPTSALMLGTLLVLGQIFVTIAINQWWNACDMGREIPACFDRRLLYFAPLFAVHQCSV